MLQKDYTDHQHVYFTIKISNNNIVINFLYLLEEITIIYVTYTKAPSTPVGMKLSPRNEHAHSDHNLNMWGILLFSTYFLWY